MEVKEVFDNIEKPEYYDGTKLDDVAMSMKMTEHTAIPWHYQLGADVYTHIIRNDPDHIVVQLRQDRTGQSEANAQFIVDACNAYEANQSTIRELVEALEEYKGAVQSVLSESNGDTSLSRSVDYLLAVGKVNESLAKAKG